MRNKKKKFDRNRIITAIWISWMHRKWSILCDWMWSERAKEKQSVGSFFLYRCKWNRKWLIEYADEHFRVAFEQPVSFFFFIRQSQEMIVPNDDNGSHWASECADCNAKRKLINFFCRSNCIYRCEIQQLFFIKLISMSIEKNSIAVTSQSAAPAAVKKSFDSYVTLMTVFFSLSRQFYINFFEDADALAREEVNRQYREKRDETSFRHLN